MKRRVLLIWPDLAEDLYRQTPGRSRCWGEVEFTSDPESGPFDLVAVFEDTRRSFRAETRATVFLPGEPPDSRRYPAAFVRQFDAVLGTQRRSWPVPAPWQPFSFNWHLGWTQGAVNPYWLDLDGLGQLQVGKTRECSCIASSKAVFPGHIRRSRFAQALKHELGSRLDLFGKGLNPVADKFEALAPYRYHVAIENSRLPGYWTEKLADALLAWTLPIYHGDPEIIRVLPEQAVISIDIAKPQAAIARIREVLADRGEYERRLPAIAEARQLLLGRLNIFAVLAEYVERVTAPPRLRSIIGQAGCRTNLSKLSDMVNRGRRLFDRTTTRLTYRPGRGEA